MKRMRFSIPDRRLVRRARYRRWARIDSAERREWVVAAMCRQSPYPRRWSADDDVVHEGGMEFKR